MTSGRRAGTRVLVVACSLAALVALGGCAAPVRTTSGPVRIGAPDDTAGMLVDYVVGHADAPESRAVPYELYELRDCCATKSQTALAAEDIDMAVLCPDAAEELVGKDPRFRVVGPVAANTDVAIARDEAPARVGVTQNRGYQEQVVGDLFGAGAEPVAMLTESLPYALERGSVQGVVTDFLRAREIEGMRFSSAGRNGSDRVTYVLVTTDAFADDPRYEASIEAFDKAAEELGDPQVLREQVGSFTGVTMSEQEVSEWARLQVRLLSVSGTTN